MVVGGQQALDGGSELAVGMRMVLLQQVLPDDAQRHLPAAHVTSCGADQGAALQL